MNGLDKIKDQILSEANNSATTMIANAQEEAKEVLVKAQEEVNAECDKIAIKAEANHGRQIERYQSSIELQRKQTILTAKQEIINEILNGAYEKLLNQKTEDYFEMVLQMIQKFALNEAGTIAFSDADLKRMPEGFEAKIAETASKNGGSLELEKEGRNIESGFILIYGGIEENCTLKAMFHSAKDELSDKVHKLLFA